MDEAEYLPLSYLSQLCYCPRRAALLLNERLWAESRDTAKGRAEHERVHTKRVEKRGDMERSSLTQGRELKYDLPDELLFGFQSPLT